MSGGSQNTTSQQTVPDWLQPYLTGELQSGQGLVSAGGPQYYPGQQVAPLTSMQNAGISGIQQQAGQPNAASAADQQNQNIESGMYLNPNTNPYLAGTLATAGQGVQNNVDSQFGSAGRNVVGSAPVQTSAMNQLANQIYGSAYQSGMTNMIQGQALAPQLDAATYLPSTELLQTGAGVQGQNQNEINASMNKYNYQQQLPENMLSWYSGLLSQNGAPFGGSQGTSSGSNNSALTDAGGAVAGASALSSLASLFGSSSLGDAFALGLA